MNPVLRAPSTRVLAIAVLIASVGAALFATSVDARACWSFLGGLALALAVASFAALLVHVASTISPRLALVSALSNYVLTVAVFVLMLSTLDPNSVDVSAFATGLAASVVPYLGWQFAQLRPRP